MGIGTNRDSILRTYEGEREASFWASLAESGLSVAERRAVDAALSRSEGGLLVVGAGTGREALALTRLGYRTVGVDIARNLLAEAARHAVMAPSRLDYVVADAAVLPFPNGCFDHVVMLGQVIGHIPGREGRRRALAEAARVIHGDGRILVSIYNRSFKDYPIPYVLWRGVARRGPEQKPLTSALAEFPPSRSRSQLERVGSIASAMWRGRVLRTRLALRTAHRRLGGGETESARDVYVHPSAYRVRFRQEPGLAYYHLYTRREFLEDAAAAGLEATWESSLRELNTGRTLPTSLRRVDFLLYFALRRR